ncbi:type II toxin-antitoxin system RelB/DinJ family antitoxin [Lactiplantibacillus plantarum]|uniref:type II toxin-antitoxin system RelB/DinJ family antitoxin n=1 Tax=Lactiplantibacillus plantarum TaxID=1590 RepID=UPI000EAA0529|nr:type II toxin-antitoxin system RelB/DinJ family antitoxin [Lactiplantibacillus plantarum]AYG36355.1 type II toxin-antitoxin system RelB/DinJ family antitoxin [Lactiplantibacillus plantarum]
MTKIEEEKTMFAMRIKKSEKKELKELYKDMGLDLSTAVNLFFKQSLLENGLPFQPMRKNKIDNTVTENCSSVFNSLK